MITLSIIMEVISCIFTRKELYFSTCNELEQTLQACTHNVYECNSFNIFNMPASFMDILFCMSSCSSERNLVNECKDIYYIVQFICYVILTLLIISIIWLIMKKYSPKPVV